MRLHYLQHVPFEGPANIAAWARQRGYQVTQTLLFDGEELPDLDDFDWLAIMGGPMSVHDEDRFAWLAGEKKFIASAIASQKIVLGVCLGAQLIAEVLGGRVYPNPHKEIGWHSVSLTPEAAGSAIFAGLPERFTAFHWHGETFDLPSSCKGVAESEACANQAFEYDGRVVGLQFHLESSAESITQLLANCSSDLVAGPYVQPAETILSHTDNLQRLDPVMRSFLNNLEILPFPR